MASSSTSYTHNSYKYDVFLSFRGEDTRKNFVDHLYFALDGQGIYTFKDDKRLEKGIKINDELLKSIEESKFYIVVFSKNYAASSWCLDELVKIMECQKASEKIAYPVFYDVDPTEVRKQLGPVGEAFARHNNKEEVGKWRDALKEAANLAGWDLRNTADGHEAEVVSQIVESISRELRPTNFKVNEKFVGLENRIKHTVSYLETGVQDVRMIGIKGIGGGGKTTLARAVFDKICFLFEGKSFVENVREVSKASLSGLQSLQEQVLSNVFNGRSFNVGSVHGGKNIMKEKLCGKKVLLVLDDVDHLEQLEALAGGLDWFKPGSRVIITTRDKQVLVAHGVKSIHDANLLSDEEAICLLSRYAFGRDIPIQKYKELSLEVVHYAAGLPLTIRVLGSSLCGQNVLVWEDALERLKTIPLRETVEKLELSYTGLEDDQKEIFLDVACLLKGWNKDDAVIALESCGFRATIGLRVLEQKSLITISGDQVLGMHDHIQEMGRNIVRRLHPDDPIKHSRLWKRTEIEDVLADELVNETTRAIATKLFSRDVEENLGSMILTKGFGNMKKLRFLHVDLHIHTFFVKMDVCRNFPNTLRFLRWPNYLHWCLPETFQANNLVALEMPFSRIKILWEDEERKVLRNLRFLNLRGSKLRTLNCGLLPNLEKLNLQACSDLGNVDVPIGSLKRLVFLDLSYCSRLNHVAFIKQLESLQVLKNLRFLNLSHSNLTTLDCGLLPNLENLNLGSCYQLVELHAPLGCLKRLVYLNLSHCMRFRSLSFIKHLESVQVLDLSNLCLREFPDILPAHSNYTLLNLNFSRNNIRELPSSIANLQYLVSLDLNWCKNLESLLNSICTLKRLKTLVLDGCDALTELPKNFDLVVTIDGGSNRMFGKTSRKRKRKLEVGSW